MDIANDTTAAKLQPPAGAPALKGTGVTYLGDAGRIGDPGTAGGSGDPPGSMRPLKYTVTSASTRNLPRVSGVAPTAKVRIRVRNESTFPLTEVRVAIGSLDPAVGVAVYGLAVDPPLKAGRSAWVEGRIEQTISSSPAVWVLLPPFF